MVSYGCHHSTLQAVAKESEVQDPLCLHTEFKANLCYMKLYLQILKTNEQKSWSSYPKHTYPLASNPKEVGLIMVQLIPVLSIWG